MLKKKNIILDDDDIIEIKDSEDEKKQPTSVNKDQSKLKSPTKPPQPQSSAKKPTSAKPLPKPNVNDKSASKPIQNKPKPIKNDMLNKKTSRPSTEKKVIKRKESSSYSSSSSSGSSEYSGSYSESSSSSGSSSSSSEEKRKKKKHVSLHSSSKKKHISSSSAKKKSLPNAKKTILKPKSSLVYQILKRWWYALPKWPPENYDPSEKLKENKLRVVQLADWKKEPNVDENNFNKCFELSGFKYVYLDANGMTHDFRPQENKPSYNCLMKKPDKELYQLLVTALQKQLEEVNAFDKKQNTTLIKDLQNELKLAENNLNKIKA